MARWLKVKDELIVVGLDQNEIFVFGSNLSGVHGAGAAKTAHLFFGAEMGKGVGLVNSTYAIPTKDENILTLPLDKIIPYIEDFKQFANENQHLKFILTRIGCGLAGYKDEEIGPLFKGSPNNVIFPNEWLVYNKDN